VSSPLVSVVLPTYDRPDRLRRAVESVAAQTYDDVQLIVVDDHSPTPSRQALADLSLDGLAVEHVRHEENRGANAARNTGIRAADGEFLAFLDDDDEWKPEKLERQVERFRSADEDVGLVYTGTEYRYDGYRRTVVHTTSGEVTRDILTGASFAQFSAILVRADVVDEAGLPDERFPSWQDREWYLRLSLHCEFEPVPEALTVRHRTGDDEISADYESKRDVSYPLFLEKHRPLAAEYGRRYERGLVASLSESLAGAAVKNGYYADARKYYLKSLVSDPFSVSRWVNFLATVGGRYSHEPASRLAQALFHDEA
jgi:glycosyltransferase involved in cell wall biosynthesis